MVSKELGRTDAERAETRKQYLEYRRYLSDQGYKDSRSLDKQLLTLSASAVGLSLLLLDKLRPTGITHFPGLLLFSWGSLILCILSTLFSFQRSSTAHDLAVDEWDDLHELDKVRPETASSLAKCNSSIDVLSKLSIISFASGIAFLCAFAICNL